MTIYKNFEDIVTVNSIAITMPLLESIPDAQALIAYIARISNEGNQNSHETADKLLAYCARMNHWSIFDMSNLVLEIKAPRDISRQLLRHQSIKFQEYSQRYAEVTEGMFCLRECRLQDTKNRQNSLTVDQNSLISNVWLGVQEQVLDVCLSAYQQALHEGVAKEVARTLLPEGLTMSRVYANGTVRSWLHYIGIRTETGVTQQEHCVVAEAVKVEFLKHYPCLAKQLGENNDTNS